MSTRPVALATIRTTGIITVMAWVLVTLAGCVSSYEAKGESRYVLPAEEQFELVQRTGFDEDGNLALTSSTETTFRIRRGGSVEYNGSTLPLFTFVDGGYIATQVGPIPGKALVNASSGSCPPGTRVQVHRVGEGRETELIYESGDGLLLGRNSDGTGFLVERPSRNGARAIGKMDWRTGLTEWLVDDGRVNAFGWLASDGTLLFSSRAVNQKRFELAFRRPGGTIRRVSEPLPFSWLFPTSVRGGTGIYCIRMGDGYADMTYSTFTEYPPYIETTRSRRMSNRVDASRVVQMASTLSGGAGGSEWAVSWYSYELGRVITWNQETNEIEMLPEGSYAATAFRDRYNWLVTSGQGLSRATLFVSEVRSSLLIDFPWIVRELVDGTAAIFEPREDRLEFAIMEFGSYGDEVTGGGEVRDPAGASPEAARP